MTKKQGGVNMSTEQIAIIVTGVVTLLVVGAIILYLSNSKLKKAKEILGDAEKDSKRIQEEFHHKDRENRIEYEAPALCNRSTLPHR